MINIDLKNILLIVIMILQIIALLYLIIGAYTRYKEEKKFWKKLAERLEKDYPDLTIKEDDEPIDKT